MLTATEIPERVERIVERIVETYAPQQVILFGSFAYGEPNSDSDLDLLIIKDTNASPLDRRVRVRRLAFEPDRFTPLSPLVLTPAELAHRLELGDPFFKEIVARGKVLYGHGQV